jgi:hypothetical protein
MMSFLGPLHAIAAQRGDGLLPEFARLWESSKSEAAAIREAKGAYLYEHSGIATPRASKKTASNGNVISLLKATTSDPPNKRR